MVKSLKDCAFPLPMNALGGSTQSFESFEGALLDVVRQTVSNSTVLFLVMSLFNCIVPLFLLRQRYWGVQRSSIEIVDNMHKLLDLDTDTLPQSPPLPSTDSDGAAPAAAAGNMSSTSSKGLVAWWTFEDGGGAVSATDVTGHRFKTLIRRRQNAASKNLTATKKPSTPSTTVATTVANIDEPSQRAATSSKNNPPGESRVTTAAGEGRRGAEEAAVPAVEGVFTVEEWRRYRIPEEVQRLLPVPYHSLLPATTFPGSEERPATTRMNDSSPPKSRPVTAATTVTATATVTAISSRPPSPPATAPTVGAPAVAVPTATPWTGWLATLPRWSWLEAETLPTPKAVALPASLLSRQSPPQLPAAASAAGNKVTNKGKASTPKGAAPSGHPLPPATQHNVPAHPSSSAASATSNGTKSVLPVPSLRARGICPYELRRHRLATAGRELQREVDCPLGKITSLFTSLVNLLKMLYSLIFLGCIFYRLFGESEDGGSAFPCALCVSEAHGELSVRFLPCHLPYRSKERA